MTRVLIAGIGAGSLGLELAKCLSQSSDCELFGADISAVAEGHCDSRFAETVVVPDDSTEAYLAAFLDFADQVSATVIAPGAEATHKIFSNNRELFLRRGLALMINSVRVIDLCSDKAACNSYLTERGFRTARTIVVNGASDLDGFDSYPCVVKPNRDSGGSNLVFLAEDEGEAAFFVDYLAKRGLSACVQEYILSPDEFTVGVLSSQQGRLLSSVALRRNLAPKLSRSVSYEVGRVISSGWSQGTIDYFPDVCEQAERIADTLQSVWALNIQGRLLDGEFIPFEINPRHSGTSYLRALAGVNEPLIALQSLSEPNAGRRQYPLKVGEYLRMLSERYVPKDIK